MFVKTSWPEKSRYGVPSPSHTQEPSAPATTSGVRAAWADQEWKTCARSSSYVRRAASGSACGWGAVGGRAVSGGGVGMGGGGAVGGRAISGRVLVMRVRVGRGGPVTAGPVVPKVEDGQDIPHRCRSG